MKWIYNSTKGKGVNFAFLSKRGRQNDVKLFSKTQIIHLFNRIIEIIRICPDVGNRFKIFYQIEHRHCRRRHRRCRCRLVRQNRNERRQRDALFGGLLDAIVCWILTKFCGNVSTDESVVDREYGVDEHNDWHRQHSRLKLTDLSAPSIRSSFSLLLSS